MAFGGFLQANTAVDLIVGPFLDETNGKDAEPGLTITQAEVRLSKNGANMAQKNEGTSLVHDELGNYVCKLDTTDTNTEGNLTLMIHESGALPVKMDYSVLAQAAYISLFTAKDTGFMGVDITAISTDTTAADNLELFTEVLENGTGLIDDGTFKAGAINAAAIANAAIDNATFAADVGSTAYGSNIIALAVRKVLDELNLDHLLKVDTGVAADGDLSGHVITGSVLAHVMASDIDVTTSYNASTDSLEAIKVHADTIKAETASIFAGTVTNAQGADVATDVAAMIDGSNRVDVGSWLGQAVTLSGGNKPDVNVNEVSDDSAAADNLESACDNYSVTRGLTGTALPAVAADGAGGVPVSDAGGLDLDTQLANTNEVTAARMAALTDWINGGRLDVLLDAIKVVTDLMAASATTLITGTVSWDNTNATTTVIYSDDVTEATADHYNGRLFVPTSGALLGQYTDITDYALDTGEGKFTVTALTEAPADNTTFVII